ncbi:lipase maturation factor family protein [Balneolaceae bacterium YR4-1]|uniref:Lipase maturation factor family protein n=1 Tax=Halalkalibaculum roseum TaxID=2709311 RepID=A0A6M1SW75_9BACT|nr:lipase maturation factor family protein [Halalkalibaculum roseum]NGP76408.1 lipase maturation factor family protein [Halalkalibaculum roseum]
MVELFEGLYSSNYWFSKFLLQRGLALIYLLAFTNALNQFIPLLGSKGLLPVPQFLERMSFKKKPSLFHWHYSDTYFKTVAYIGFFLSLLALSGISDSGPVWASMVVWFLLWIIYLSIVNVGNIFYGFGWESMLLEAGFYAIFLGPLSWSTPILMIWIFRWMVFRVEFGAGLIKMRGDSCWRDLTCLNYHHETQPLPNSLSWFFHQLPEPLHKAETFFNHLVQLVIVWGLFFPQPVASIAAGLIILSQGYLIISGNYSWLNWLTIILAFSGFSDEILNSLTGMAVPSVTSVPFYFETLVVLLTLIVIYLSFDPVRNMLSKSQKMNFSFNPIHLVNTYGAFGSVTKERYEIIIEGTDDKFPDENATWKAYEFKGKPGNPARRPPLVSPYHLRLDWQMWFAAMSRSPRRHPWFQSLIARLLQNDESTLNLLRENPFPEDPPLSIRARLFKYEYTSHKERKKTGNWWKREYVQDYMKPQSLYSDE